MRKNNRAARAFRGVGPKCTHKAIAKHARIASLGKEQLLSVHLQRVLSKIKHARKKQFSQNSHHFRNVYFSSDIFVKTSASLSLYDCNLTHNCFDTNLFVLPQVIAVITVEPADKISFVYNCMQTRLSGQCNGKWLISLVCVSRPLVTVIIPWVG